MMTGKEAVDWIHGRYGTGNKEGLTNTAMLMERLGNPHTAYPCIHVAGTNGKGSVCSMLASVLKACGYKTGMYTSPYLEKYNERIRVDGEPIANSDLGPLASDVRAHVEEMDAMGRRSTVFEIGTACAFEHFRRAGVDIAVIETGMGGRLDSTNVITPVLSVIAHIGLDHMSILGDTVEQIASEKAGIVKPGVPCVLYPQHGAAADVITRACGERQSALIDADAVRIDALNSTRFGHTFDVEYDGERMASLSIPLAGDHQIDNARTVLAALAALRAQGFAITIEGMRQGLADTRWPGRLEWFGNILLEGAHNEQGALMLAAYARKYLSGKRIAAVCAISRGKADREIVRAVAPLLQAAHCVSIEGHRANDPQGLADIFNGEGVSARAHRCVAEALAAAKESAGQDGIVLVFGSLYLVGEMRPMLTGRLRECV